MFKLYLVLHFILTLATSRCHQTNSTNDLCDTHLIDIPKCISASPNIICSGRGKCVCGVCECDIRSNPEEKYFGKYCECDNFYCARHNNQLCSGPDQGICECGICVCLFGWTGPACSCSISTDTCRFPGETVLCSGKGECVCGECKCETTEEGRYSGRFCDRLNV